MANPPKDFFRNYLEKHLDLKSVQTGRGGTGRIKEDMEFPLSLYLPDEAVYKILDDVVKEACASIGYKPHQNTPEEVVNLHRDCFPNIPIGKIKRWAFVDEDSRVLLLDAMSTGHGFTFGVIYDNSPEAEAAIAQRKLEKIVESN